jgi:DNA-binding NtrC family response regulator
MLDPKKKILIVEDDPGLLDFLARVLMTSDRELFTASTVAQAREIVQHEPLDLMLVDLFLPDGSGIDLLSSVKQDSINHEPSAIVMTAFGSWESHIKAYHLGVYYYLDKPFRVSQIKTLVQQALDHQVQ